MNSTKRVFAFTFLLLLLAGCGDDSVSDECSQQYWDGTIGVCLPEQWEVIDEETLRQRGVPEETLVAFQYAESVSGQFPTATVTQETLSQPVEPSAYSQASIRAVSAIQGYTELDTSKMKLDDTEVSIHVFSSQPVSGEPERRFYQVSTTKEQVGYTFTVVTPFTIEKDLEKQVIALMKSVTFQEPESE